jgi:5'-3' exoribonuclease 2
MSKQQKVNGIPMLDYHKIDPCQGCLARKYCREQFRKKSKHRSKEPLGLINFDLYEPMAKTSLNGSRYFLLFTDNFSKKSWVYYLRTKGETFTKFKAFKEKVEVESGCKIKVLQTNPIRKFLSKKFI